MGDTILISRRLEGQFLAWKQAIPRNNPIRLNIDRRQLLTCIERVSLIVSEKLKSPLRCVLGDDNIDITTRTAVGVAHDCCPAAGSGGGLEIGFNNKYMLDALRAASCDQVVLEMSSPITPCIIVPAEGEENFLFMVLPVRLRSDLS
jgi:DNA polymerase-3 subunit beta